jgi:hypothetical protein
MSSSGGTIFLGVIVLVMESFEASRPGNFDSVSSSACKTLRLRHGVLANDLQNNECDRVRDVSGACERRRNRGISIFNCKASVSTKKKERQAKRHASSCVRQGVFRPLILAVRIGATKYPRHRRRTLREIIGRKRPGPRHGPLQVECISASHHKRATSRCYTTSLLVFACNQT